MTNCQGCLGLRSELSENVKNRDVKGTLNTLQKASPMLLKHSSENIMSVYRQIRGDK